MSGSVGDRDDRGFTLVELLVAITILGIIMGAIGAMIATAFRTSSTVSAELSGSRGPKMVSRYWVPDVEQAAQINSGGAGCAGGAGVATLTSTTYASNVGTKNQPEDAGTTRIVEWAIVSRNGRTQLVRCVGTDTTIVVADLDAATAVPPSGASRKWAIDVTVPDRSQASKKFDFSVAATQLASQEPAP